jgi:hypothetical protein
MLIKSLDRLSIGSQIQIEWEVFTVVSIDSIDSKVYAIDWDGYKYIFTLNYLVDECFTVYKC